MAETLLVYDATAPFEDVSYGDPPGELIADVFNGDPAVEAEVRTP